MARPQEFDEQQALTAAMHAFRRDGFAGVSIKDLERETGLSSGSIYNSFGHKSDLFRRVLDHYNVVVVKQRIAEHMENATPAAGLRGMFLSLLDEPGGGALGCLLTNSAIEFAGMNIDGVTAGLNLLREAFERSMPGSGLRLLTFYQGLLVLIRHGHAKAELAALIETELASFTGET